MAGYAPNPAASYRGHRFPAEFNSHVVWRSHRFGLSLRDVEDLLAERGVTVTYESIRQWCQTVGPDYARRLVALCRASWSCRVWDSRSSRSVATCAWQ